MKKKDLKTGMRVETRNGETFIVMLNSNRRTNYKDGFVIGESFHSILNYNDDLTCSFSPKYDIMKVYSYINVTDMVTLGATSHTPVWEKPESFKMITVNGKEYSEDTLKLMIIQYTA